jgi:hypothetical protein
MNAVRQLWMLGLTSPIIYLIIGIVIDRKVFAGRETAGFWPLEEPAYKILFGILATVAIVSMPVVAWLKSSWASRPESAPSEETDDDAEVERPEPTLFETPQGKRFTLLFMICDTVAVLGLVLFLIQGHLNAMLFFGVVALIDYAVAYPGNADDTSQEEG